MKWAAPCQEWHEQQHQWQSKSLIDSDQPSSCQESRWCYLVVTRPESKGCRVAREVADQFRCWHLGSQRHRSKMCPNLAPQFMRPNARGMLDFRRIRNNTKQAEKPRRDWSCNSIRPIHICVQFWCLDGISEDGIQALFKVSNSLV